MCLHKRISYLYNTINFLLYSMWDILRGQINPSTPRSRINFNTICNDPHSIIKILSTLHLKGDSHDFKMCLHKRISYLYNTRNFLLYSMWDILRGQIYSSTPRSRINFNTICNDPHPIVKILSALHLKGLSQL